MVKNCFNKGDSFEMKFISLWKNLIMIIIKLKLKLVSFKLGEWHILFSLSKFRGKGVIW